MSRSASSEALPLGSTALVARDQRRDSPPARPGRGGAQAQIQAWLQPGLRSLHFRACAPRSLEAQGSLLVWEALLLAERGAPFFPEGARVQASRAPLTGVRTPALHPPAGLSESPWRLCWFAGSPMGRGWGGSVTVPGTSVPGESCFHPRETEPSAGVANQRWGRLLLARPPPWEVLEALAGREESLPHAPVCRVLSLDDCRVPWPPGLRWEAGSLRAGREGHCSPLPLSSLSAGPLRVETGC